MRRDPRVIADHLKRWRPILRKVYRCQVDGLENIPPGQHLFVANHNIGFIIEILALLDAWESRGTRDEVYALAHPIAFNFPGTRKTFAQIGCVPATYEAAGKVLAQGHSLMIFPGGNHEAARPFWQARSCDFGEHLGWLKLAIQHDVPIVPIAISGSHLLNPVLIRWRWISRLALLPAFFRVKWFPVTVAQVASAGGLAWLLAPLGLPDLALIYVLFIFSSVVPILPLKVGIKIGSPIRVRSGLEVPHLRAESARIQSEINRMLRGGDPGSQLHLQARL